MLRGRRHVALITADLFAALLGQRDIEHQDEHRKDFSICITAGGPVGPADSSIGILGSSARAYQADSADQ